MEPFKNKISPEFVQCLAGHLERRVDGFQKTAFEKEILSELHQLELKQRARLIADVTTKHLPEKLESRFSILRSLLHSDPENAIDRDSDENGICGWGMMPLGMIVSDSGLNDFAASFDLMKEMTKRATAEFDVRPFLAKDPEKALSIMKPWTQDPNVHVRRLVSEGTRPRLPWGMRLHRLIEDPSSTVPLLEALKDDREEYVRRSVANHLNDIAKDHPALVSDIAANWLKNATPQREKLVRHACRSLIKNGYEPALRAFGLNAPEIHLADLSIKTEQVRFGSSLSFSVALKSTATRSQDLIIDYVLHFRKANGKLAPKVFKWTKATLEPGTVHRLSRFHPIRPITTRTYYGGTQAVSLRINGQDFGYQEFDLQIPDG
ncbi:DNA alkylation repair protein [Roseibium alexandrii]|uniref:DNA alkylation repair enzyme n=1 Tax=Roseibium alexandrii TaxID=388408 RepID=A0A0M7AGK3_9HYPH|nr:DNA alkylation repair protein [Roseibium alexandrii]CTQ73562.1 DNA alkylation repair enzyme [Roseibium alexandrii]